MVYFDATPEGQEKALAELEKKMEEGAEKRSVVFQKGPTRIEIWYQGLVFHAAAGTQAVITDISGLDGKVSPHLEVRSWWGSADYKNLSSITSQIHIKQILITRVAMVCESCDTAQSIHNFPVSTIGTCDAVKHIRNLFTKLADVSKRGVRTWQPVGNTIIPSQRSPQKYPYYSSSYPSVLDPLTHFRVAGDQECVDAAHKLAENIAAGRDLVALPSEVGNTSKEEDNVVDEEHASMFYPGWGIP